MQTLTAKVEAIRSPIHYAGSGGAHARLGRLQAEFAEVLGVPTVYVRNQGVEHFLTGDPADCLCGSREGFPSGTQSYEWADRGDGVLYGTRRTDR